jgi:hypothetical protein
MSCARADVSLAQFITSPLAAFTLAGLPNELRRSVAFPMT